MWFLKFIGLVAAYLLIRFIIDLVKQSREMSARGGVRKQYSVLVDNLLECHPDCKIFQQDNTMVVVGVQGIAGSQFFYIHKTFSVLTIQMKVRNNPLFGNVDMEWKFPEDMDQTKMIEEINMSIQSKLSR